MSPIPTAAKENVSTLRVQSTWSSEGSLHVTFISSLSILKEEPVRQSSQGSHTHLITRCMDIPFTVATGNKCISLGRCASQILLYLETLVVVQGWKSGQQPGVLEFPTRPKHLLPLSIPELLLGPVTASSRASKLRAGSRKDLGRESPVAFLICSSLEEKS